ncbi:MAG: cell division protein FtsQ/DivIB [Myxococcales bacterium]
MRGRKNRRRVDQAAVRAAAAGFAVRAARFLGAALVLGALAVGAAWGARHLKAWLFTSPTFAIEQFAFEGLERAEEAELIRLGGIRPGDNIFEADIVLAERAMAAHPWVEHATIDRVYPRKLKVKVVEHEPAALTDLGGLYYVNRSGKAFKRLAPGESADLPILRGVGREEYSAAPEEAEALFKQALDAMALYREAGLEQRAEISEISIDRLEGLTFFLGDDAVAVRLGQGELDKKLARLGQLFDELSRRGARAEVIRLDNRTRPGWVAVQLAEGAEKRTQ